MDEESEEAEAREDDNKRTRIYAVRTVVICIPLITLALLGSHSTVSYSEELCLANEPLAKQGTSL